MQNNTKKTNNIMKSIFKSLMLVAAAAAMLTQAGCEDRNVNDPQSDATPSIKYIRPTDPALADKLLESSPMGETIAIIGSGLEGVVEIFFNDVRAELNPTLVTEHSIICNVPAVMPTEITNTMTLKTGKGNICVYDFAVDIPVPFITGTSCEWAKAGSEMTLYGSYLFPYEESNTFDVTFPGGKTSQIKSFDSSSITVVVPDGALEGTISVEGEYGIGMTKFSYRESTGMFIDCENVAVWDGWSYSGAYVHDDEESIDGSPCCRSTPIRPSMRSNSSAASTHGATCGLRCGSQASTTPSRSTARRRSTTGNPSPTIRSSRASGLP